MIQITTQPREVQTILQHTDFNFLSRTPNMIRVETLSLIVNSANVDKYIFTLPKDIEVQNTMVPFYLQHADLFNQAQKLFEELFNVPSDIVLLSAYKTDCTTSSFLFSNKELIEKARRKEQIQFHVSARDSKTHSFIVKKLIKEEKSERPVNNIIDKGNKLSFTLPAGVFPVIGFFNTVDPNEKHPNLNLIFGSLFDDRFFDLNKTITDAFERETYLDYRTTKEYSKEKWITHIDPFIKRNFGHGLPLYCVRKFDLKDKEKNYFDSYNPDNMTDFYNQIDDLCFDDFVTTTANLLLSYSRASYLPATITQFECSMPHFYNIDRIPSTVKKKPQSQIKLKKLYEVANRFGTGKSDLCFRHFIEFFILESIIDFEMFMVNPGEEIAKALVEKRTIKQLIGDNEILSDFLDLNIPNQEFTDFVVNQIEAKDKIRLYIGI
jgi:hypothetical protein